jgi:hypothetical protein
LNPGHQNRDTFTPTQRIRKDKHTAQPEIYFPTLLPANRHRTMTLSGGGDFRSEPAKTQNKSYLKGKIRGNGGSETYA